MKLPSQALELEALVKIEAVRDALEAAVMVLPGDEDLAEAFRSVACAWVTARKRADLVGESTPVTADAVSKEDRSTLTAAGYIPEIRWRRTIGKGVDAGISVICTTGEALKNVELDTERARKTKYDPDRWARQDFK